MALAATVVLFAGTPAGAAVTTTTSAGTQIGTDLLPGVTIGPAVVTTPGQPTRHLTSDQATAFMQT